MNFIIKIFPAFMMMLTFLTPALFFLYIFNVIANPIYLIISISILGFFTVRAGIKAIQINKAIQLSKLN